jgi:hypothetical protein
VLEELSAPETFKNSSSFDQFVSICRASFLSHQSSTIRAIVQQMHNRGILGPFFFSIETTASGERFASPGKKSNISVYQ